jgi:hypothetical protein
MKVFNAFCIPTPLKFVLKYFTVPLLLAAVSIFIGGSKSESLAGSKVVPFKAGFETVSVVLAPPPKLQLLSTGNGIGSHIGNATLIAYPTIDLATPPPFSVSGPLVITAANGDELFASFAGTRSAPDVTGTFVINATYTISGGTGRFENASGVFEGVTLGRLGSTAGSASYEGHISY